MRILQLIHRYPPAIGGSEVWCREVSRHLAAVGHRVDVMTLDDPGDDGGSPARHRSGRFDLDGLVRVKRYPPSRPVPLLDRLFHRLLFHRTGFPFAPPHSLELYAALLRAVAASDLVHLQTLPYPHNLAGMLTARLFARPVALTPHFHAGHPLYEAPSSRWLLRRADVLFAQTDHERDLLTARGVESRKIVVTGGGLHPEDYERQLGSRAAADLRARYGLSPESEPILFIGRKEETKGIPLLAEAAALLARQRDVTVLLAGPDTPWFRGFFRTLPAADRNRVIDVGTASSAEKVELLRLSKLLVLPSPNEAFGLVFLEAWACGRPVIGAAVGPVQELLAEGGLTFQPGDANDLAAQIERILSDPGLARRLARRGREKTLARHTWPQVGQRVNRGYRRARGDRLRILVCNNLFPPHVRGGAEIVAERQARALAGLGHEVRVLAGRLEKGGPFSGRAGVTWVDLEPGDLLSVAPNERARRAFRSLAKTFRPDVVHFHNLQGLSPRLAADCARLRLPSVLTLHDYWAICFKTRMVKNDGTLCRRSGIDCLACQEMLHGAPPLPSPVRNGHVLADLRHVDRFLACSRYLAQRLVESGLPADRVVVQPPGIDLEAFPDCSVERLDAGGGSGSRRDFTVGYVGQLAEHKGVDVLLRAIALGAEARLVLVGAGPDGERLRGLARELGIAGRVDLVGRVDHRRIAEVYRRFDAVAVPSLWAENSPLVIAEAMASGLPVIASDLGGSGELVADGETGYLVPPGDPRALAERIERLRLSPELWRRLGARGRETISDRSLDADAARLTTIYEQLLDGGVRQAATEPDILLYACDAPWSPELRQLLYELSAVEIDLGRRFWLCRADRVDKQTRASARLIIVPTPGSAAVAQARAALRHGVPVLVAATHRELRQLCRTANAGLEYAGAAELRECLRLLLGDESLRRRLNAQGLPARNS